MRLGVEMSKTYFPEVIAVKTVDKFHAIRLPLLGEFWADNSMVKVLYMSNTAGRFAGTFENGCKVMESHIKLGGLLALLPLFIFPLECISQDVSRLFHLNEPKKTMQRPAGIRWH